MLGILLLGAPEPAEAAFFKLSTRDTARIGGVDVLNGDVVDYDASTDTGNVIFSESLFLDDEDIDALSLLMDGRLVFSTANAAVLGGLSFADGDLVAYDPFTDTASLLFSESLFSDSADIDAVHMMADGTFLLSTDNTETLGGLTFQDGDVVHYDPGSDVATLFFSESNFSQNEDIDGIQLMDDGTLVLSTSTSAQLGGLSFRAGDLVQYDLETGNANLFLSQDLLGGANIDAILVPEPSSASLLGLGLLALTALRSRTMRQAGPRGSPQDRVA